MASRGVNLVILLGRVGQDPETRYLPSGGAVTNVTLATSEVWKDKNTGENQERTEWHRLTFFGRLAEIVAEHVTKGMQLYVTGKLQTNSWEQDGVKRYSTSIICDEMQMLGGGTRRDGGGGGNSGGGNTGGGLGGSANNHRRGQQEPEDSFDDDIPF